MAPARIHLRGQLKPNSKVVLEQQQVHYLLKVLRLKNNALLQVFDDGGNEFSAQLQIQRQCQLSVQQRISHNCESPLNIHLGQVITRGKRMDYSVQKATELGVTSITPLVSSRCVVKPRAHEYSRLEHWQAISCSAAQQCFRSVIPTINSPQSFDQFLHAATGDLKIILHEQAQTKLNSLAKLQPLKIVVLIGPEGGFSPAEINQAQQHEFQPLLLGARVLRSETAAPVILGLLQYLYGDM